MASLKQLEAAGAALFEDEKVDKEKLFPVGKGSALEQRRINYRNAQRAYAKALASTDAPAWIVTDLVTLGSPLGRADMLLSRSPEQFELRKRRREFPSCPPFFEFWAQSAKHFSYPSAAAVRIPHHGSPFAPTVWTNILFPTRALLFGDPIAGECEPHFGPGVKDVLLPNEGLAFQHSDYWKDSGTGLSVEAIAEIRSALNLANKDEQASAEDS